MEGKFNRGESHGTQLAEFIQAHDAGLAFKVEQMESLEGLKTILLIGEEKLKLLAALEEKISDSKEFASAFSVTSDYLGSKEDPLDVEALEAQIAALNGDQRVVIARTYSRVVRELKASEKGRKLLEHALVIRASDPVSEGPEVHNLTWIGQDEKNAKHDVDALLEVLDFFAT